MTTVMATTSEVRMNSDEEQLRQALTRVDQISDAEWLAGLDDRKRKELAFHDRDRDRDQMASLDKDTYERFYGNKKYYAATGNSKAYVDNWIEENSKDRIFLDYACGNGLNAIKAATAGATLAIGLDISRISVENAKHDAAAAGLEGNTYFIQADAENTQLPDSSINAVICSGMLHHLDLSYALPELRRILKPGGRILAVEALDYNPTIKLYRHLTPDMRTEWEKAHILNLKDLDFASRFLNVTDVRYWHITSILAPFFPVALPVLNAIDSALVRIPGLRLMAWIFTFVLEKPMSSRGAAAVTSKT